MKYIIFGMCALGCCAELFLGNYSGAFWPITTALWVNAYYRAVA